VHPPVSGQSAAADVTAPRSPEYRPGADRGSPEEPRKYSNNCYFSPVDFQGEGATDISPFGF